MAEQIKRPIKRPQMPPPSAMPAMTPKEIMGIIRRHLFLIFLMTTLGLVAGGASWYLLQKHSPKYTAETYIRVLPPIDKDPTKFGSTRANKDIEYGSRQSIASLIRQQSTFQDLLEREVIQETKWFKSFGESKSRSITKAVKQLKKKFGVSALRDGDYVRLAMTCKDAREAALIVNEMVNMFISSQGSSKRAEVTKKLSSLETQRTRVQRDLDSAESALDEVRTQWGFGDLEERTYRTVLEDKLRDLETEQNDLGMSISQIRANIGTLEKQAEGPINEQIENQIETDPVMTLLAQQLALQQSNLAGRLTKFGENHRLIQQARETIEKIREKRSIRKTEIAEQTRQSNLKNAQDNLVVLMSRYEELERMRGVSLARKTDYDQAKVQFQKRVIIRDERKDSLNALKEQIEKMKIVYDDPETPKVQAVGMAPIPLEISFPKWQMFFPAGFALGFMLGIGLAFLVELLNDTVRTPADIGRYLRIPLLGVIPDSSEDYHVKGIDMFKVTTLAPYTIISEAYRKFRANIQLSESAQDSKTLLVSSGMAGDGKTSVASNLAMTLIASGNKVLLIDANFWKPNLHNIYSQDSDSDFSLGLSSFLRGDCGSDEIVKNSNVEGLDLISSGESPSNPAELLSSGKMKQLIAESRNSYDYVIIDGPPVLLVSDVKVLARNVDGSILVFNAATTKRGAALRTLRELREVNAPVVGCVLFAVKALKGGYFNEQYKSYEKYNKAQLTKKA